MKKTIPVIGYLANIPIGIMWGVYAPYLKMLGYSATLYGLIGGSGVIISAISSLLAGLLSDEVGAKKIALIGLVAAIPSYILIYIGELWSLFAAALINGFSGGFYHTAYIVMVSRSETDDRLHHAFSTAFAYSTMGDATGLFMGWLPVLMAWRNITTLLVGYRYMFLLANIFVVSAIMILLVHHEERVGSGKPLQGERIIEMLKEYRRLPRALLVLLLVNSIIGFGAAMSIHNIGYYFALKYGVTSGELGSVLGVQQLLMGLMMLRLPRIVDKVGDMAKAYLLITSPSIPLLVAMTLVNNYLLASTIYIIRSILMNLANPLFNSISMKITPPELRGRASSILSLPWTLLGGVGRAVGGALMDIDVELPLRTTALLYTAGLSIMGLYFRGARTMVVKRSN